MTADVLLQLDSITKVYPGVIANRAISLDVRAGEIHALLGENGAGKSTLMNVIYGLTQPDSGRILWQGVPVRINSPRDAIRLGIGMVHQHFMLVPLFTALENIVLQNAGSLRHPQLATHGARVTIQQLCDDYGLAIDLDRPVEQLSLGMQQRIEIVKALYGGAQLLILDEPTAVLTPPEVLSLFNILRRLTAAGRAALLISHKLEEVMAISQRVSVLRDGQRVVTVNAADSSPAELAQWMIGRPVSLMIDQAVDRSVDVVGKNTQPTRIELAHVSVPPPLDQRDRERLSDVSLMIEAGEILGIAGVDGNGQRALFEALCGLRTPNAGTIRQLGSDTTHWTARQVAALDIGRIADDRQTMGLLLAMPVRDNLTLRQLQPLAWHGWLRPAQSRAFARNLMRAFTIRAASDSTPVRALSGGNQQKVILARELAGNPAALIVANPTRGLDIGATEYVHQQLREQRDRGAAVLLISSDLEEIFALSDRIGVLYSGKLIGLLSAAEADRQRIGLLMGGARAE